MCGRRAIERPYSGPRAPGAGFPLPGRCGESGDARRRSQAGTRIAPHRSWQCVMRLPWRDIEMHIEFRFA
ncbi:hypothetical protein X946_3472 [Burkholderia sp. ABCPW 111]|nr:hypothetical protein X946_3472 [Burkholderia sp. ABCPW 111]